MEGGCMGSLIKAVDNTVRKKRSKISRWPRSESFTVNRDESIHCDTVSGKKELNLNQCVLNFSSSNCKTTEAARKRIRNDDKVFGESDGINGNCGSKAIDKKGRSGSDFKSVTDSIIRKNGHKVKGNFDLQSEKVNTHTDIGRSAESRSRGYSNEPGNQNNIRKVKLKVGSITRTIHTNSTSDAASAGGMKLSCSSDAPQSRQKMTLQDAQDDNRTLKSVNGLQGVPWKDFSGGKFCLGKEESSKDEMPRASVSGKKTDKSEPVRKSRRVPKRRVLDGAFDDEDDDDEIRYLEKLRNLKVTADCGTKFQDAEEGIKHQRKVSRVSKSRRVDHEYVEDVDVSSTSGRDGKKSRSERGSEDRDYVEEEEPRSDGVPDARNKIQKESVDSSVEANSELSLTRRQRALQSGKDASTSSIEFPNGLPPAPSRKNKEKLSEVEQQLKKAEAAQRRRIQVEKAAKESQDEAIRKILGQDSSRKKKEDKLKKRRDELAQERAANAHTLPPNTVRWVIGPTGTVVTFSEDVGLPSIFNSKPCSYPPPREKCVGPSCINPYVYRDSKSKLPLCSLKCYKAIHEQSNT